MILFVDTTVRAGSHVPFNSALLRVLRLAYPGEDILMAASGSHIAVLRDESGMDALRFDCLDEEGAGNDYGDLLIGLIKREKPDNVVVSACTADQLRLLRGVAIRHPSIFFDAFMHSELAQPAHRRSRNPLTRRRDMFGTISRGFPSNVRLNVLEYAIKDRLRRVVRRKQAVAVFPHPLPRYPKSSIEISSSVEDKANKSDRKSISFLGGTFTIKGFDIFLDMAEAHSDVFDFQVIGERAEFYSRANDRLFSMPPSDGKLKRSAFDRAVEATDLICLPLNAVRYSWAASGTLLDAIAFGIPVLTTRTAITTDWERRYGRFGLIAENGNDVRRVMQAIRSGSVDMALNAAQLRARAAIAADRAEPSLASKYALHGRAA